MGPIVASALLAMSVAAGAQPGPQAQETAQAGAQVRAPATAITVGDRLAGFANLTAGTRTYLRYMIRDNVWRPVDIWRREVRFDEQEGQRRLHIVQSWTGPPAMPSGPNAPPPATRDLAVDSWFEEGTFRPISHERRSTRGEEVRNEGFLFTPTRIQGLASTPSNSRAQFTLDTPRPVFNFETDMEILQTLPLAEGYAARLLFYHPGGPPPSEWVFRVTGSTRLPFGVGQVESWVVTLESADAAATLAGRFFVARQGQQVLRVEQPMPGGGMVVKQLIETAPTSG
jgi:hypothetical protein